MDICKLDILKAFSDSFDLVNPKLVGHHNQVAYISVRIAAQMGISSSDQLTLAMAALVHDVGVLSLSTNDRLNILNFEADGQYHADAGYRLLKLFKPFEDVAQIVRYHHSHWAEDRSNHAEEKPVPLLSYIIHVADRVAVLINKNKEILSQVNQITEKIKQEKGKKFHPESVVAFLEISSKESFWFDSVADAPISFCVEDMPTEWISLTNNDLINLSNVFSQLIDFRSSFTATHSAGVAATAEKLAELIGFTQEDCLQIRIAAYLHDLGKLAVPKEILEKPSKLTRYEFNVIKSHTYFTYRILEKIPALNRIKDWASYHHEKLDGQGYPFHLVGEEMELGSKIMAIADVFTAITEDRPYRKGMSNQQSMKILENMSRNGSLHTETVDILKKHFDELIEVRKLAQEATRQKYDLFRKEIMSLQANEHIC